MDTAKEIIKCQQSVVYFTRHYCQIRDDDGAWVPFSLWPDQAEVLRIFASNKMVVALKARQIGMTWLALAYALHLMIFQPGVTVLLFSLREKEAIEILDRLIRMYEHLPAWLKYPNTRPGNKTAFELPNESRALAFPSGTGDSYTAKLAIIDEADLIGKDLGKMINSVKPTIDAGGQLFLVSKSNKAIPDSPFKKIYRAARDNQNEYRSVFLPWNSRPERTQVWYEKLKESDWATNGNLDYTHENYPNNDSEALAPSAQDKRIPSQWIENCLRSQIPMRDLPPSLRHIQGLKVYKEKVQFTDYVLAADPAEGNPNSDDSAIVVLERDTGEEVASFASKTAPRRLAEFSLAIAKYYNNGAVLVERNNHGGTFIDWWLENGNGVPLLNGTDKKPGWQQNIKTKTLLFDHAADCLRDCLVTIHTRRIADQLQMIEGSTLKAAEGEHDDLAMAFVMVLMADNISPYRNRKSTTRSEEPVYQHTPVFGVSTSSGTPFGVRPR